MAQIMLLAVSAVWGSTFLIVAHAVRHTPPIVFLALRFSIASLVLFPGAWRARGGWAGRPAGWAGLWLFAAFYLQTRGLLFTGPDRAAFLTALNVLCVPVLELLVYRMPVRKTFWVVGGTALAGLALVLHPRGASLNAGDLMVLGTAVAIAAQIIATARIPAGTSIARFTWVEISVTALLAWAGSATGPAWHLSPGLIGAALYTGVLASALAFWAQTWSQTRLPAFAVALIFITEPLFATLIGATWGHRPLTGWEIVGGMIVVGSLASYEWLRLGRPFGETP
ncbi:MAG: DMT family transporter [Thermaerobacter sp.]|nr:DMT family transporter [Thermaerobacter sp.]